MELLEREEFLRELADLSREAAEGRGRVVLVSGEAGIGKTSLVERFAEGEGEGTRFLWGACDALFTPRPLGPLDDVARQTGGELLALLEREAPRAAIFSAFLDALRGGPPPSVVVVEDVHWADEATLDLLKFVGRRIQRLPSMLLVTYRDDEVGAEHPLRFVLGDLPPRAVRRLRLPPLSEAAVASLARSAGREGEALYATTGGNPFFVTEVLASRGRGAPATVRDAVLARAARLSPAARSVLEVVSIVPARAETWLLDEVVGAASADALDECARTGMLRQEAGALAFRHELARLAVEESLAGPRRQSLNARVLRSLSGRPAEQAQVARLVHHAAQASDAAAVLRFAPQAARQASALSAHREAASHYRTALRHADALAPAERAALFEALSYECYLTQQIEEALEARRAALEIWGRLGESCRRGDNLRWLSRLSWFLGRKAEADLYAAQAVDVLEALPPGPELAMAYSNRAHLHVLAEDVAAALSWGNKAVELAERLGNVDVLVHALNNVGLAGWWTHDDEGHARLERSLRLSLEHDLQEHAARAYTNLGSRAALYRDYAMALAYLDEGIAYSTEHDLDSWSLYMTAWRARVRFGRGDWPGAEADAGRVLGHYRVAVITKIPALAVLGHLRARRGDPEAASLLDEARDLAAGTGELQRIAPVAAARAEAAWLRGDGPRALAEARDAFELARRHENPWALGELGFWVWRAGGLREPPAGAAAPYALHMAGDWRAAAEEWVRIGCPYERALALADGDREARLAALEIFERLGAGPAAESLRRGLRAAGVRGLRRGPRPATKENPAGLTARQMEVLALLAEGLSNADIAERLYISPKTVDHHVSAVLAKLDARTRAEAAARAVRSGLLNPK
jgi:DNA-binding CsgD family transcriptional regulator/tetratricopeptide (TPR) repeat protein